MGTGNLKNRLLPSVNEPLGHKQTFLLAFPISVFGSMGLGALHLAVIHFTLTKGWAYALAFSLGCVVVEMLFVYMAGRVFQWIERWRILKKLLNWTTLFILLVLGAYCLFFTPAQAVGSKPTFLIQYSLPPFFLGMVARSLLPTMVSFWLGWKTVIFGKGIRYKPLTFALGAGLGTILMHGAYMFGGQMALDFLGKNVRYLYWAMGLILLGSAMVQFISMRRMTAKTA